MSWTVVLSLVVSLLAGAAVLVPVYKAQKKREVLQIWMKSQGWSESLDEARWRPFLVAKFGGSEVSRIWMMLTGTWQGRSCWAMEYWALVRHADQHRRWGLVLRPYTVIAVELHEPLAQLELTSTEHDERVIADVRGGDVITGNPKLDEAYRIQAGDDAMIRQVLRGEVTAGLVTLLPRTNFVFAGSWLVAWEPTALVPETLERIRANATWFARWVDARDGS